MQPPYLFISHSTLDAEPTEFVVSKLTEEGYRCWVDVENMPSEAAWVRAIETAITECAVFVLIMTSNARAAEWVEREALLAMRLNKPILIAQFDDTPLPIYIINRQATDFRKRREAGMKKFLTALGRISLTEPPSQPDAKTRKRLSPKPNEANFFKYLEQLPGGETNQRVARAIYTWAVENADNITFSGRTLPAFHAHTYVGAGGVVVFSVRAFARQPAIEIPLQYLTEFPPYDTREARIAALHTINALLPARDALHDTRADRRPTVPLTALDTPENMTALLALIGKIMDDLRAISNESG